MFNTLFQYKTVRDRHHGTDQYSDHVVSLVDFVGANQSTIFLDKKPIPTPRIWTRRNSPNIVAGIFAPNSTSSGAFLRLQSPPLMSQIDTPYTADMALGTLDFCAECFVKMNTINTSADNWTIMAESQANSNGAWILEQQNSKFSVGLSGTAGNRGITGGQVAVGPLVTTGGATVFYHVAIVRSGSAFTVYVNGTGTLIATNAQAMCNNSSFNMILGANNSSGTNWAADCYLGGFRYTVGVPRYTADFIPPLAPFAL